MTEAEKAEAAKVEAAKKEEAESKAKVTKGAKSEETEVDEEEEPEEESNETLESLKAHNAKLKEENKKRRLDGKTLKAEMEKRDKALAALGLGKKEGEQEDPLERAKKESDLKMARTLMKAEFMSLAKDAHDPMMVFKAHYDSLKDIEVDLDNETVDVEALTERIGEIRKKSPFLFQSSEGAEEQKTVIKKNPDKVRQGGGGSEYKEWQKLVQSGDKRGAQAYYGKNKDKILLQM